MGFLSSLFSEDKESRIHALENHIESHKRSIDVEKNNLARFKLSKLPKHQLDGARRKIEYHKQSIKKYREEIKRLKKR